MKQVRTNPSQATVHALFAERTMREPHSVALVYDGQTVTCLELDAIAGRVTACLRAAGVGRGDRIGVRLPHTPVLFAALLGVMRVGAAYVPGDVRDPEESVAQMFGDADVRLVLAAPGAGTPVPGIEVLEMDDYTLTAGPTAAAASSVADDDAYVIYTSGSTGCPKGIPMTHGALVNLLSWHRRARATSCASRTIQLCRISFDFSFHEIFATLCLGGQLVLVPDLVRRDPTALARFLSDEAIERLFAPVSMLTLLVGAAEQDPRSLALRDVLTTGERLQLTPVLRSFLGRSGARLHNHYGATEFQDATTFTLEGDPAGWPPEAPIGRPIDNVEVLLLDTGGDPVRPGEAGELYVGGAGVARGYLGRPDLTAERFVPHPSGIGRLFRTGDLACLRSDGQLEYCGRAERHVEIRGSRVDPAQLDARLKAHPVVREAAVVAVGSDAKRRLVAHVVLHDASSRSAALAALRTDLAAGLPPALMPDDFVVRDAIPLTPSGKIDRRALS